VLAAGGKYSDAQAMLLDAAKLFPSNAEIWIALGTLEQQSGQPGQAGGSFRQAIQIAPTSPPAQLGLAEACLAVSDFSCAMEAAATAVQLAPTSATAHARKAQALCGSRQHDEALAEWRTALHLDPSLESRQPFDCH
jgi:Tfp pilus assembly protein PilF